MEILSFCTKNQVSGVKKKKTHAIIIEKSQSAGKLQLMSSHVEPTAV